MPPNSKIKDGLKDMAGHIKAAKRIGAKLNFTAGTSNVTDQQNPDTTILPDTSPIKEIKLRKQRRDEGDKGDDDGAEKKKKKGEGDDKGGEGKEEMEGA